MDDGLDERSRPHEAARLRHRASRERRAPGRRESPAASPGAPHLLSEMRFAEGRARQPVRLHAVQGALPLRELSRTLRLLQGPLVSGFHALRVASVRPETRDALVVTFESPADARDSFRYK